LDFQPDGLTCRIIVTALEDQAPKIR
jgi:hypothetical protein